MGSETKETESEDRERRSKHRDGERRERDRSRYREDKDRLGSSEKEHRRERSRTYLGDEQKEAHHRERSKVRGETDDRERRRDRSRVRDRLGDDLAEKDHKRDRGRTSGEEKEEKSRHRERSKHRSEKEKEKDKRKEKKERKKRDTLTVDTTSGAYASDVDGGTSPISRGTTPVVGERRFNPNDNYGYQPSPSGYGPPQHQQDQYSPVSPITPAPQNKYGAYPPPSTTNSAPSYAQNMPYPSSQAPFSPPQTYNSPLQYPPPPPLPPGNVPPGPQSQYKYDIPPAPAPPPPPNALPPVPSPQAQYKYEIPPPPPPPPPMTLPPLASSQPQYQYEIPPAPPPPPPVGQYGAPQNYNQYSQPPPIPQQIQGDNPDYGPVEHNNPEYWNPGSSTNTQSTPSGSGLGLHHVSSSGPPPPPPLSPGVGPHNSTAMAPPSPIGPHFNAYPQSPQQMPGGYSQITSPTSPGHHGHSHSHSLSIPGAMAGLSLQTNLAGGASPALLPYQGTYQSISPMPSPTFGPGSAPYSPPGMEHFSIGPPRLPSLATPSKSVEEEYDPLPDAKALLTCLNHVITRVDPEPIIRILPKLTPSQLISLRAEYKQLYHKVNVAKHIKMQVSGALGKVAWVVALGPYESEGWWANSWYQKAVTRNELIIEALVGKSVQEIREIKKGFRDGKYGNSLEKAVKSELESHKFRSLILMCLNTTDGIRDEEPEDGGYLGSVQGHIVANPQSVRMDKVQNDVRRLFDILRIRPGSSAGSGETTLMEIILCRNDVHLREVIRWYRQMHGKDLSKVVLEHSQNLVGEALTHRLAGLIDKPLRDAKLLDNAIKGILKADNPKDDLFVSRIVRVHWDKTHLERVKTAYAVKYKVDLVRRVQGATTGTFRDFLVRMLE